MKTLISTLWNGEPVVFLGIVSVVVGGLATAGLIPVFVAAIIAGIATVIQRQKVSPSKAA